MQLVHAFFYLMGIVRDSPILKLFACLTVDGLGFSTYLLPGIGEAFDAIWAPMQAWFLYFMFGTVRLAAIGFFEEILPGTDFVPSALLGWLSENIDEPSIESLRALTGVRLRTRSHQRAD